MIFKFCAVCGAVDSLENHHFIPKALGGSDMETNLITLCPACHGVMHSMKRRGTARALTTEALAVRKALGWKLGSPDPPARWRCDARTGARALRTRCNADTAEGLDGQGRGRVPEFGWL